MLQLSMEAQLELLQQEASTESAIRSMLTRFSDMFDGMINTLRVNSPILVNTQRLGFIGSKVMDQRSTELNYVSLKRNSIRIPSGMKVTYKTYFGHMNRAAEFIMHIDTDVLMPMQRRLLQVYGQPDLLMAGTQSDQARQIKKQHDEMTALKKNLAGCFNPNSNVDVAEFGTGFANMAEWREVSTLSSLLTDAVSKVKFEDFSKQMDKTLEYAQKLRNEVITSNSELKASSFGVVELSTMLYNVADIVEFLGAFITYNNVLATAYNEMALDFGRKFM